MRQYVIVFWRRYEEDRTKDKRYFYIFARTKNEAKKRFCEVTGIKGKDIIDVMVWD